MAPFGPDLALAALIWIGKLRTLMHAVRISFAPASIEPFDH
jgi:hypothetical protein